MTYKGHEVCGLLCNGKNRQKYRCYLRYQEKFEAKGQNSLL